MSNLYKYIQTINENETASLGNDGEIYERLIAIALKFLVIKKNFIEKNKVDEHFEEHLKNIQDFPKEIEKLQKDLERLKEILAKAKDLISDNDKNEIDMIINEINFAISSKDIKKINEKIKEQIKNTKKTTIKKIKITKKDDELLNRVNKWLEILEIKNEAVEKENENFIILQNLKEIFKKPEYLIFFKCYQIIDLQMKEIQNPPNAYYLKAYEIAKKINEAGTEKTIITKDSITEVIHIGSNNGQISKYWQDLFKNEKDSNQSKNIFSKNESKSRTSKIKTDIILKTNDNKIYNLSLKMEKNRYGTPTYSDIYTLLLHAINKLLIEKSKPAIMSITTGTEIKKDNSKELLDVEEKLEIYNSEELINIEKKLKKFLNIENIHTGHYITIINICIMLDLICQKFAIENNVELLQKIKEIIEKPNAKELKEIFKDNFLTLFLNENEIDELTKTTQTPKLKNELKNAVSKLAEEKKNAINKIDIINGKIILKNEDIIEKESEKKDENTNDKKIEKKTILGEFIKKLINIQDGKYFGNIANIDKSIEKIIDLFNKPNKKEIYINALQIRNLSKESTFKLNNFFKDEQDEQDDKYVYLKEIFSEKTNSFIDFLKKNKNFIKNEIILEALTGKAKFVKKEHIANYMLTFGDNKVILEEINKKYVEDVSEKVNIIFAFKGGDEKSFNVMQIGESFFDKIKNKFQNLKLKVIKIIVTMKNKAIKILSLLGIRIKIKKATMPQWMIDKL